ncbi:MAG TPA: ABC transporter permease [Gelria sp.]|jgi:cell division transport system permease protein|nr:ABC transporter permease [Gelria sp.]
MRPGSIIYFLREAFKSLSRNRLLSIATISTVAISILILGFAVLLTINAGALMQDLESDVEIVAFLDKKLTKSQITDIKQDLTAVSGVKSVKFVSREQALAKMQEKYGGNEYNLKETLGKNPLPHSYEIKADDPHNVPQIAGQVSKIDGIYKVNYGQGVVERLFKVTRWVRIVSIVFIVLLVFAAVFLIATTIRLAIFARRKEIYLMKLIGSTDWFIRWPFFIEGVFMGAVGGLIAILILAAGYSSLIGHMDTMFFIPLVTSPKILRNIYIGLLVCGATLGVLGTWVSLNRFLDV